MSIANNKFNLHPILLFISFSIYTLDCFFSSCSSLIEHTNKMGKSQSCNYNKYASIIWICIIVLGSVYEIVGASDDDSELSWSKRAAIEAESVAAKSCSGHGRAYLDGLIVDDKGLPVCECNPCYEGPDCSQFKPNCDADAGR